VSSRPSLAQRLAVCLIVFSVRRLPEDVRVDYFYEWMGELPSFFTDPEIWPQARRTLRALLFAADNMRGVLRMTGVRSFVMRGRKVTPSTALTFFTMSVTMLVSGATVILQLFTSQWKEPTAVIGTYVAFRLIRWRIRRHRQRSGEAA
jgi:hypothetical protein